MKKVAFTLAEVLITLGIIGVVAAITIPTLVSNYKQKAWDTASYVFERKLEESLKAMNTQQTLAGHRNTLNFVKELSKHYKITNICENDNLLTCFEDKVYWGAGEAEAEEVDMTNIKTASQFGQEDWDTEIIGVQLANGVTGLIAYNPGCVQNPYSNQIVGTSCLAILYDTDGFKTPNTLGKDLRNINVNSLGSKNCAFELGGVCFGTPFYPTPLTKAECENSKGDLGINSCNYDNDYWAGAVKACGGVSNMPNAEQLKEIAKYIYGTSDISTTGSTDDLKRDDAKASALGFSVTAGVNFFVWTGEEYDSTDAYERYFSTNGTLGIRTFRRANNAQAVCLSK